MMALTITRTFHDNSVIGKDKIIRVLDKNILAFIGMFIGRHCIADELCNLDRRELKKEVQAAEKTFYLMTELFDVIRGTANMAEWTNQENSNFKEVSLLHFAKFEKSEIFALML